MLQLKVLLQLLIQKLVLMLLLIKVLKQTLLLLKQQHIQKMKLMLFGHGKNFNF
jgi:hypothetical protein